MKAFLALIFSLLLGVSHAGGQANVTFSGGNGSRLYITLSQPVIFTLTAAEQGSAVIFVIENTGNVVPQGTLSDSGDVGDLTYSINGGSNLEINTAGSGFPNGMITANDLTLHGQTVLVQVGDFLVLNAGTFITYNEPPSPPPNGSYTVYVASQNGADISTFGVSIPEPGEIALLMIGGTMGALWRFRCFRNAEISKS